MIQGGDSAPRAPSDPTGRSSVDERRFSRDARCGLAPPRGAVGWRAVKRTALILFHVAAALSLLLCLAAIGVWWWSGTLEVGRVMPLSSYGLIVSHGELGV